MDLFASSADVRVVSHDDRVVLVRDGTPGPPGPPGIAGPPGDALFSWGGDWSASTNYQVGSVVAHPGADGAVSLYYLFTEAPTGTPPTDGNHWTVIAAGAVGAEGPQGPPGAITAELNFPSPGYWHATFEFNQNDVVRYAQSQWRCINPAGSTGGDPPPDDDGTTWQLWLGRGPTGPTGPAGPTGIRYRGNWVSGASYQVRDIVRRTDGAPHIWICTTNTSSTSPPNSAHPHWALFTRDGIDGQDGAQGPAGPTGPASTVPGPQGPAGPAGADAASEVSFQFDESGTLRWLVGGSYVLESPILTYSASGSPTASVYKNGAVVSLPVSVVAGDRIAVVAAGVVGEQTPFLATIKVQSQS